MDLPLDAQNWNEYQWEAFLRRQDDQMAQYIRLLDHYGDHPDAHNLVASSMGWSHLLTNCVGQPDPQRCSDCPQERHGDCRFHELYLAERTGGGWLAAPLPRQSDDPAEYEPPAYVDAQDLDDQAAQAEWNIRYGQHPVHGLAAELVGRLNDACARLPMDCLQADCPFCRLLHHCHRCVARLSAALAPYAHARPTGWSWPTSRRPTTPRAWPWARSRPASSPGSWTAPRPGRSRPPCWGSARNWAGSSRISAAS